MQVLMSGARGDVGKDVIAVAVRLPGDGPDRRATHKRTFKTFYGVLREAARWLSSLGVTHVAMEATGIYSMPVYHALIEHGEFTQVLVCNAGMSRTSRAAKPILPTLSGWCACWSAGCCGAASSRRGHQGGPRRHPVPAKSCSPGPQSCNGSAACSRTPASRSTRWPRPSPPSRGGR